MLDARTVDVLRGAQERQAMEAAACGSGYQGQHGLVFTNEVGSPLVPEQLTRALPRAIRQFNAERRVHALYAFADADEPARLARAHGMGTRRLAAIRTDDTLTGDPLPAGITFHSLRHLHASVLLASGRGLAAVQRRLGHSSITVSSDLYGHLIGTAVRDDAEAAAALIPRRVR